MDETYPAKKYEADKIALLGFFIIGLVIAGFMTSSRYTGPLKAGSELVAEIKRKGISTFLDSRGRQTFFLIRNPRGRVIGFTMDVFTDSASDPRFYIQSASLLYIRGKYGREQVTFFKSDNSFNEFPWRSETAGPAGRSGTDVLLGEDGLLTVTKSGPSKTLPGYKPGPASIPNFLVDLVFAQMLESGRSKIIVDIIEPAGTTTAALISRIETRHPAAAEERAACVLKLELLNNRGFSEEVYFDGQGKISKILLQHNGTYLLERTTAETVLGQFPERADFILQNSEMFEKNQP